MKYRNGFVTNSSSSSYVCEICTHVETGYDMDLEEARMIECEKGHTFCTNHYENNKSNLSYYVNVLNYALKNDLFADEGQKLKILVLLSNPKESELTKFKKLVNEMFDDSSEYNFPPALCPICNKTFIDDTDILKYAAEKFKFDVKDIKKEITNNFYRMDDK